MKKTMDVKCRVSVLGWLTLKVAMTSAAAVLGRLDSASRARHRLRDVNYLDTCQLRANAQPSAGEDPAAILTLRIRVTWCVAGIAKHPAERASGNSCCAWCATLAARAVSCNTRTPSLQPSLQGPWSERSHRTGCNIRPNDPANRHGCAKARRRQHPRHGAEDRPGNLRHHPSARTWRVGLRNLGLCLLDLYPISHYSHGHSTARLRHPAPAVYWHRPHRRIRPVPALPHHNLDAPLTNDMVQARRRSARRCVARKRRCKHKGLRIRPLRCIHLRLPRASALVRQVPQLEAGQDASLQGTGPLREEDGSLLPLGWRHHSRVDTQVLYAIRVVRSLVYNLYLDRGGRFPGGAQLKGMRQCYYGHVKC